MDRLSQKSGTIGSVSVLRNVQRLDVGKCIEVIVTDKLKLTDN